MAERMMTLQKEHATNRMDRLKGPRSLLTGLDEGASGDAQPQNEPPSRPLGPEHANEEWRRLYETVRRATERLRD